MLNSFILSHVQDNSYLQNVRFFFMYVTNNVGCFDYIYIFDYSPKIIHSLYYA